MSVRDRRDRENVAVGDSVSLEEMLDGARLARIWQSEPVPRQTYCPPPKGENEGADVDEVEDEDENEGEGTADAGGGGIDSGDAEVSGDSGKAPADAYAALVAAIEAVFPPGSRERNALEPSLRAIAAGLDPLGDVAVMAGSLDQLEDILEALLLAANWPESLS